MAILTGLGTSFVIATDEEALSGADVNKAVTPDQVMAVVSQGVSAVSGGLIYKGVYNATDLQPDLSNARQGDFYKVNVGDTAYGKTFAVGDMLLINADMGGVIDNNKVDKIDNTESLAQLDDLSDVVITNATTGEVLRYNGSNWVDAQLAYSDLTGTPSLATVATTGAYSDLSGTPSLATVATTGAYSDLSGTPTLGTAAALNVGTSASQVVQLDGSAKLPAVDGSQLTNLPSGGGGYTYSAVSTATTAVANYHYSVTGTTTITLPAASSNANSQIRVKNMGANTVTIAITGGDTIDGQSSASMPTQYQSLTFMSNGSNGWEIV